MAEIVLGEQDSGKTIEVQKGDTFIVSLNENPTTGFLWADSEPQVPVLSLSESDWSSVGIAIGAGGIRVFRYKAEQAGEVELILRLMQEWEPEQADREFRVRVHVTGDDM